MSHTGAGTGVAILLVIVPCREPLTAGWVVRGRLVARGAVHRDGWVLVHGSRIEAVGVGRPPGGPVLLDLGASLVAPGFVDVHVHGGGGAQVSGDSPDEVAERVAVLTRHHARHGTTAVVATTVADTPERLETAARGVALARRRRRRGDPAVLGLHLEGPWLSPARRGAHARDCLRPPDPDELGRLVSAAEGALRLVTVAPELPGADELIAAGRAAGITMSVGHTDADFATTRSAFAAGVSHVTHLGNAMPGVDRREPGPVAAALLDGSATLEVIADGLHLHPGFLAMVAAAAPERLVAVTDAVGACGMPPGRYSLGGSEIVLTDEGVVLAEAPATLAGSVLTMDRAVANLVDAGLGTVQAIQAATATPARVVGATTKGVLSPGADADLVILDEAMRAVATVVDGVVAWDPEGRLAGIPAEPIGERS